MKKHYLFLTIATLLSINFTTHAERYGGSGPYCPENNADGCNANNANSVCRCSNTGKQGCCNLSSDLCTTQYSYCHCDNSTCWSNFTNGITFYLLGIDNVNSTTSYDVMDNNNNVVATINAKSWYKLNSGNGIDCSKGCTLKQNTSGKKISISFTRNNGDNASVSINTSSGSVTVPYQDGLDGLKGSNAIYLNLTITDQNVTATDLTYNVTPFNPDSNYTVSL